MKNARSFFDDSKIYSSFLFLKYLIIIFVAMSFLASSVNIAFYQFMKNKKINEFVEREQRELLIKREQLLSKFQDVYSDFLLIKGMYSFENYLRTGKEVDRKQAEKSFIKFLKAKKYYDQIRYINCFGKEKIRITRNNLNNPNIKIDYQDKSDRYYFKDGLKLPDGCLGISDFDLNVEYGKVEIPYKPVIRFFMKIFNPHTKKYGVIVINRLGKDIINLISKKKFNNLENIYFVHESSHFISSPNKEDNWGNSLIERKDKKFQNIFPSVWEKIIKKKSGVITSNNKLFIFNSVYFEEMFKDLQFYSREKYWKIICVIPIKKFVWQEINSSLLFSIFFIEAIIDILLSLLLTMLFVSRKRAKYELQREAYTDPLTGLLNRRFFFKLFNREIENAIKNNYPIAISMGDIDFFKKVNDTYGHEAGDIVLREIAQIIKKTTRDNDIICRWGGEEILILFPQCDIETATNITQRIRLTIEKHLFHHKRHKIKVTMSFGVSIHNIEKNNVDESIANADEMLYHSKKNGRNKVTYKTNGIKNF